MPKHAFGKFGSHMISKKKKGLLVVVFNARKYDFTKFMGFESSMTNDWRLGNTAIKCKFS